MTAAGTNKRRAAQVNIAIHKLMRPPPQARKRIGFAKDEP